MTTGDPGSGSRRRGGGVCRAVLILSFFALLPAELLAGEVVFGPKEFVRTGKKTDVFVETFASETRRAQLVLFNGTADGERRVTSAVVTVNGETLLGPAHFKPAAASHWASIDLEQQNTMVVKLLGKPGSFVTIRIELEFVEKVPAWRMPELSIEKLTLTPERADPGDEVVVAATVKNVGRAPTGPAELAFFMDQVRIGTAAVAELEKGAGQTLTTTWIATGPGRHVARAELFVGDDDSSYANNTRVSLARVSGQPTAVPDVEMRIPEMSSLQPMAGQTLSIPVKVRNLGFSALVGFHLSLYADDDLLGSYDIDLLEPEVEADFLFDWTEVTPGAHTITAVGMPDEDVTPELWIMETVLAIVPDYTMLFTLPFPGDWVSLGPNTLDNQWAGRITALAFDPDYATTSKTMWAGGWGTDAGPVAAAGVWKSTNAGSSWTPVGDKVETMMVQSLAVDPENPSVIYFGSRDGIYKSINDGLDWSRFAGRPIITPWVSRIVIHHTSAGEVFVFAGTSTGVQRYKGTDPLALTSTASDWDRIKLGDIRDLMQDPGDPNAMYAVIQSDGFYRTNKAMTAKVEAIPGNHDWVELTTGLPDTTQGWLSLDIHDLRRNYLYAGITKPKAGHSFGIYRSTNYGFDWETVIEYPEKELDEHKDGWCGNYNPFLRVAALDAPGTPWVRETIYFGGACLFQYINHPPQAPGPKIEGGTFGVSGYHVSKQAGVDMKTLEFDPSDPAGHYFVGSDQGVFRCKIGPPPEKSYTIVGRGYGVSPDACSPKNDDLRVTQFYDIDTSKSNPDLLLGGTQDTGTLLFEGDPSDEWTMARGGDGLYSLIGHHSNDVMYSQEQALVDTRRSGDRGASWPDAFTEDQKQDLPTARGLDPAWMVCEPSGGDGVLARGDGRTLLWFSSDLSNWVEFDVPWEGTEPNLVDPGVVTRVIVYPGGQRTWLAGTSAGRILFVDAETDGTADWTTIYHHGCDARVQSMAVSPADPDRLFVLFHSACNTEPTVLQLDVDPEDPGSAVATNITNNLPTWDLTGRQLDLTVIQGDPHSADICYVGTSKGVYRRQTGSPLAWTSYNTGLPLTSIMDLVIAADERLIAATKGRGAWAVITSY